ncbi:L-idonate 5-dehydrogenase [Hartmannibacter diazotrophicus]|nr:L-idonate 5-dehydrogenase [Hartmannibacter diazotrophicus]
MRAIVAHQPHDLRIEEWPDAAAPGPGEVRVRVARGGICGSDLHYYHHAGFGTVRLKEPMILGHEVAGRVMDVGVGVSDFAADDPVAINPGMPCNDCHFCRKGQRNQCLDMSFFGSAMRFPHMQGLFRDEVTVPAEQLYKVPQCLDLGLAACAEPFAVCLHAVASAGSLLGAKVLVSGCGPIGNLVLAAARHAGAREIVAVDIADAALTVAGKLGADSTINLTKTPDGLAPFADRKGLFDAVFECSGAPKALAAALDVVRPGGALVTVGLGGDISLPLNLVVTKEILMRGSFRFDAEFGLAVHLIATGAVDLTPLISATMPAADADAAFRLASDRSQSMKVQLAFA